MKKRLLVVALILGLIYSVGGIYFYFFDKNDTIQVKNISSIKGYDYTLKSNATPLMKEEFNILKENLESEKIDEEKYALSVAKLFIIDIYTINNKLNKYDVGGLQYVMPIAIENFKLNITNTLYKYLEDNSNNKRNQKLPSVKSITLDNQESDTMTIEEKEYPGFKIKLSWDYIIDLEYEESAEIIVIKDNDRYYVAEKK